MDDKRLHPMTPLEKAMRISEALAEATRRARFSSRSRRLLSGGGFGARKGEAAMRWTAIISFWLIVAFPVVAGITYFGFIASDQFVAETRFTVSGGEPVVADGFAMVSGIPSVTIIQDTQIVVNFLESRAAVEQLQERLDIRKRFSDKDIDYLSRFDAEKPIEKLVRYWKKRIYTSIKLPAGIVEVRIRAFTPEDALLLGQAALQLSENLINDLNARMDKDALRNGEAEVERASQRLLQARVAMEKARNDEGILDVGLAADAINKLLIEVRAGVLKMQQEYATQLRVVGEDAPQMKNLKARINATNVQIDELEAKLTNARSGVRAGSLAVSMTRFAALDLERQIAERLYAGSVATLEIARMTAERRRMYLNTFVHPALPQESLYPNRPLMIVVIVLGSFAFWGILLATISFVRNHMA